MMPRGMTNSSLFLLLDRLSWERHKSTTDVSKGWLRTTAVRKEEGRGEGIWVASSLIRAMEPRGDLQIQNIAELVEFSRRIRKSEIRKKDEWGKSKNQQKSLSPLSLILPETSLLRHQILLVFPKARGRESGGIRVRGRRWAERIRIGGPTEHYYLIRL